MATVAILDDDPGIQSLLADVLELEGHCASTVSMTGDPRERLMTQHPDLIILDVWLDDPGNGWQILRGLKDNRVTRDIPVIITSGAPQELASYKWWLIEHHVGILEKPFEIDDFCTCVETALRDPKPSCAWEERA